MKKMKLDSNPAEPGSQPGVACSFGFKGNGETNTPILVHSPALSSVNSNDASVSPIQQARNSAISAKPLPTL